MDTTYTVKHERWETIPDGESFADWCKRTGFTMGETYTREAWQRPQTGATKQQRRAVHKSQRRARKRNRR